MKTFFKIFTVLLFVFFANGCYKNYQADFLLETLFEDNDKRLLDYNSVQNEDKQLFWSEEFDNNDSKWPVDITLPPMYSYDKDTAFIEYGKMIIDVYRSRFGRYWGKIIQLPVIIDENKNFELEMKTSALFLYNGCSFSNPSDTTTYYTLCCYRDTIFLDKFCAEYANAAYVEYDNSCGFLFKMPISYYVYSEDFNLTTIRKIGNKYSFFVNGKYFYTVSQDKFSCNPIRFMILSGINKFDFFRLSYIP